VPADTPAAVTLHDNATPGINAVSSLLDHLDGKTAHTTVTNTVITQYLNKVLNAKPGGEAGSGGNPIGLPPVPHASGGPVWPGQPFLVGEQGPEIVQFGASGFVTPSDVSARAINAGAAPANVTVQARVFIGDREITDIVRVEANAVAAARDSTLARNMRSAG